MIDSLIFLVMMGAVMSQSVSYYDIPSYYGHFSLEYFNAEHLLAGKLTLFEYHFAVDVNYRNDTLYFANQAENCIYTYQFTTKTLASLVGNCGSPGNILGSIDIAEFNAVSSVAYFQPPNEALTLQIANNKLYLVKDTSCNLNDSNCELIEPYPPLTMDNLRVDQTSLFIDQPEAQEFLFIADTGNHCIKKLSFKLKEISVIAGTCGQMGFLDGPLGYNRLNLPRNIGVSREGVIFFFDSGNEYIRIIKPDGHVQTLLLGACKEYHSNREFEGFTIRQVLCYQNWIQKMTQGKSNHYFDPSILQICTAHSSQCQ